jgi:hypothetical protein
MSRHPRLSSKSLGLSFVRSKDFQLSLLLTLPKHVGKRSVVDRRPHLAVESRCTLLRHAGSVCATKPLNLASDFPNKVVNFFL